MAFNQKVKCPKCGEKGKFEDDFKCEKCGGRRKVKDTPHFKGVDKIKSINLFKQCNFVEEGILKEYLNFKGIYHDSDVLAYINK